MTERSKSIALITGDPLVEGACRGVLTRFEGMSVGKFDTIEAFRTDVLSGKWWGLLIDVGYLATASPLERMLFDELNDFLPLGKIRWSADENRVEGTCDTFLTHQHDFLGDFFGSIQRQKTRRAIRRFLRRKTCLNVSILPFGERPPQLCNTYDVSDGGAFLVLPDPLPVGTTLTAEVKELAPNPRVTLQVRWILPWGQSCHHFAGMGVSFQNLTEEQQARLRGL